MSRASLPETIPRVAVDDPPPRGRHVVVVPGMQAPLVSLDLPARLRGQAREDVARRQLRDRLGSVGEHVDMRPYSGATGPHGWTRVLLADRTDVARWRADAGPGCRAVLPDYLALPAAPGIWSLAVGEGGAGGDSAADAGRQDHLRARLGLEDGFAAEPALARVMLMRALEAEPPQAVLIEGDLPWLAQACAERDIPVLEAPGDAAARGLPVPRRFAHGEEAADLRTDPQAARARLRARVLPWRWPALAACLAAGLWAAAQVVSLQALNAATDRARAAALAQTRASFVPEGPVLDIRAQVSRALDAAHALRERPETGPPPMRVLARAAQVLAEQGARTDEVDFAPDQSLVLVLDVADFAAAEALVGALQAAGFVIEAQESRVSEDGADVRSTLRLSPVMQPIAGGDRP